MNIKLLIPVIAALFAHDVTVAQNNTNSPYSTRGYGELEPFSSVFSRSLGGASNGLRTKRSISLSNPASLGALSQVSLEFAFRGEHSTLYNSNARKTSYNGNFNYFSLGFPVYRKPEFRSDTSKASQNKLYKEYRTIWSSAIGLSPFSNVNTSYYKLQDTTYGQIGNYYQKTGGLNRLFFMNAVNIRKNLSLGLNTSFIFGQLRTSEAFYNFDTGQSRVTFNERNSQLSGFRFDLGLQGEKLDTFSKMDSVDIGNGKKALVRRRIPIRFVYGATVSNASSLNFNTLHLVQNKGNYFGASVDTVINETGVRGKAHLPLSFSAGFSVTLNNRWMMAADYRSERWANLKTSQLFSDSFINSSQINIGFAYRPDPDVEQMNLTRIAGKKRMRANLEYRFGFRLLNTGYLFKDNMGNISPLKEYGISFGIGIPKLRDDWNGKKVLVKSLINFTGEYIHRGNTTNGMIAQDLFRVTIGFTLCDIWFKQKKFY